MKSKKLISVVIPVFNERDNIPVVYEAVTRELQLLKFYDYELVFVNDGSADRSWEILNNIVLCDENVKAVSFSRNFGRQIALTAGYDRSSGDCIISMDADMQDPPNLIAQMVKEWEQGARIVYARRIDRKDGILKRITAGLYYRILSSVSDASIPRNVGDFRLIDKSVLNVIQSCREKSRYLRGMVAWSGFSCAYVDFKRPNLRSGKSGYTWKKMFKLALDGLTGFSTFPLRLSGYLGALIIFLGFLVGMYMLYEMLVHGASYALAAWLAEGLIFLVGGQFMLMWLLGEYVGRIHEQQKGRPLYVVAKEVDGAKLAKTSRAITSHKVVNRNRVVSP